ERREVSVLLLAAAAPVTAVEVDDDRRAGLGRGKNVELLPRRCAVRHVEKRFQLFAVLGARRVPLFRPRGGIRHGFLRIEMELQLVARVMLINGVHGFPSYCSKTFLIRSTTSRGCATASLASASSSSSIVIRASWSRSRYRPRPLSGTP